MKIEDVKTFEQFGGFLEEVKEPKGVSFESLLNKFAELSAAVDNPLQANKVLQKLQVLKPGDGFDKRIADLAGKILDFTLVGSDGVLVKANLELLSQKTDFFRGLQRLGGKEAVQMQCRSEFPGKTLELMVNCLTNGSIPSGLSEEQLTGLKEAVEFYGIHYSKLKLDSYVFFENHPQVIRPEQWKIWAKEAGIELETITDEEAYAALSEGKNIEAMLESPCRIFGGEKTVEETRMLIYIPHGLTLEDLGKILKTRFSKNKEGYEHIDPVIFWKLMMEGYQTDGGWYEMTKDFIPESKNKTYAAQKGMVQALCNENEHYEVPKTLQAIACYVAWIINNQELLFSGDPFIHTRCKERNGSSRVEVGGFSPAGLWYDRDDEDDVSEYGGIVAMRKLS